MANFLKRKKVYHPPFSFETASVLLRLHNIFLFKSDRLQQEEPSQISTKKLFVKIANSEKPLNICAKSSIFDV